MERRKLVECPVCGGDGVDIVPDSRGEPTRVQCEFCRATGYVLEEIALAYNDEISQIGSRWSYEPDLDMPF